MTARRRVSGGIFFACAALALACGADDADTGGPADAATGSEAIAAPSASEDPTVDEPARPGERPEGLPADVPVHRSATPEFTRSSDDGAVAVRFRAEGPIEAIVGFYASEFQAEGWATQTRASGDGHLILADKPDRKALATIAAAPEGGVRVDVLVTVLPR